MLYLGYVEMWPLATANGHIVRWLALFEPFWYNE